MQIQFSNIVDVQTVAKNSDQQIQVLTVKATRIELSAMVGNGKSLVVWSDPHSSESAKPAKNGLSGLLKKKAPEMEQTSLVLLITPRVITGETK